MRARFSRRRSTLALSLLLAAAVATPLACSSSGDENTATTPATGGAGGAGGQGGVCQGPSGGLLCNTAGGASTGGAGGASVGGGGSGGVDMGPQPNPGEVCPALNSPSFVTLSYSPQMVWVAPGKSRSVTLTVSPDFCARMPVQLTIADGTKATMANVGGAFPQTTDGATQTATIDFAHPTITFDLKGLAAGTTTLTAVMQVQGGMATMDLPIDVRPATVASCSGMTSGTVAPGGTIGGTPDVGGATLGLQAGADMPATTSEDGVTYASPILWAVNAFPATLGCSPDIVPAGFTAVGPAITFGPASTVFAREIPMAIPIEPAAFPDKARLRHLRVSYSGPGFTKPRTIPIANPKIVASGSGYVMTFLAPRLGTYQAVMKPDAGSKTFKRKLTHKAVVGVSMGGGGAAIFGLRHHDKFDVLAPLGGPVDWTWMLDHIEANHIGGFVPNDGVNVPPGDGQLPLPKPKNTYEHPSSFNQWWYEYPRAGNGGTFARSDYTQIFRDLALMYGNPNSQNDDPGAFNLPRGVPLMDKSVQGDHTGDQCHVFIDPIDGSPTFDMQKEEADHCPMERCAHPLSLSNYYDDEFNPKGTWPVITVCDGAPQDKSKSPWANAWAPSSAVPLEVGLAVDYNKNGIRDLNEPILRQGHEKWKDYGADGIASVDEPGYMAGVNDDPAGDDYQAQYNPNGTENDARHQDTEAFDDFGLDGVPGTGTSPFDIGEGDKKFTVAKGLQNFWDHDSRSALHQWNTPPGGPIDDAALQRLDIWTDGGTRDLFNFEVAAQHLIGSMASRDRDAAYYTSFGDLPGQTVGKDWNSQLMRWDDLPGAVLLRYGPVDATKADLDSGAGQHVGTANDLLQRLQTAFYFIGERWPDGSRAKVEESKNDPDPNAPQCQIIPGNCDFDFTDSRGRTGPVTISLPPGYAHKTQTAVRYPVMFVLHGYGQNPQDLGAAKVLLTNWMNTGFDSTATRFPKAIAVYVDGRCRIGPNGVPECIRGSFYTDSPDPTRGQFESWFLELSDYMDKNYRTMGETEVDWPE